MTRSTKTDGDAVTTSEVPESRRAARADMQVGKRERARDITITLIGSCGVLVMVWLLVSVTLQLSLTVFVTGSMSPTMPAGSVAVVQTVAATDLAAGDVVTVTHADSGRPVTHRIVDIESVAGDADARTLSLKGDANDVVDTDTYTVQEVPRVLLAVPVLGTVFIWAKSPIVMMIATLLIAAAIAWALWPGSSSSPPKEQ